MPAHEYQTRTLPLERIDQAFPLVRDLAPDVDLARWHRFAEALAAQQSNGEFDTLSSPGGVMVAERAGYIRGLFTYQVLPDLEHERVLLVQNFIVLEVVRREAAAKALMTAAVDLARDLSARAIHVLMGLDAIWAIKLYEGLGHSVEALALCHQVSAND